MQTMVPTYLEFSMDSFLREQAKLREQMTSAFGGKAFQSIDEQVRANMILFSDAVKMFSPFPGLRAEVVKKHVEQPGDGALAIGNGGGASVGVGEEATHELETLKTQMAEMQAKLRELADKD